MEPSIFFDEVNERQGVFHRRTFLFGGAIGLGSLALVGRLMQLQVFEAQAYQKLSANNSIRFRLVPPPRGAILDRNGVEIASNRPDFLIMVRKEEIDDPETTIASVAELLPLAPNRQKQILRQLEITPSAIPVSIATDLTWTEFARVTARLPELPGVTADMGESRVYPFGGAFAHVVGYVSKISQPDLDRAKKASPSGQIDPLLLHPGFRIGKQGVEYALDAELRGKPGGQKIKVDSVGRVVTEDPAGDVRATPGKDVVLTLDADVQNRALEVFGAEAGAAVAMDVHTGDILCLVSTPSFDPNRFVSGVASAEYQALHDFDHQPLLNKALSGLYHPGSTFKTMVALAALEMGFDPKRTYTCHGTWQFGNHVFKCDHHHGTLDLHAAIAASCDVYFYQASLIVGPDRMADMGRRFGLGQKFDIGIPGQKAGIVPDTAWKKRYFQSDPANQKWFAGETPSMGIGQGATVVNALQLCTMAARIANGSHAVSPRLIQSIGGVERPPSAPAVPLNINPEHIQFIQAAMTSVANDPGGTAVKSSQLGLGSLRMAGKTGTAQDHAYNGSHGAHGAVGAWAMRDNAWFVCYAPADAPRYALSVLVEHGGFGADTAAPRAREIMKVALLKDPEIRQRIERPLQDPPKADDAQTQTPASLAKSAEPSSANAAEAHP